MRRWVMVLAVVFAFGVLAATFASAATKNMSSEKKMSIKAKNTTKSKTSVMAKKGAGPKVTKKTKCYRVTKWRCPTKHKAKRYARPAHIARGPVVNCPAPVVNVPQQAAPIVNVPQQPAPVVNVAAPSPTVGITVDNCNIYIVRGDQLTVIDKSNYECKRTVPLK